MGLVDEERGSKGAAPRGQALAVRELAFLCSGFRKEGSEGRVRAKGFGREGFGEG